MTAHQLGEAWEKTQEFDMLSAGAVTQEALKQRILIAWSSGFIAAQTQIQADLKLLQIIKSAKNEPE